MKYCSNCGIPASDEDNFCIGCGFAFESSKVVDPSCSVNTPQKDASEHDMTRGDNTLEAKTSSSQKTTSTNAATKKTNQSSELTWKDKGGCAGWFMRTALKLTIGSLIVIVIVVVVGIGTLGQNIGALSQDKTLLSMVDHISVGISKLFEGEVTPEFKNYMDGYERFIDDYIAFMETYNESGNVLDMLDDYTDMMARYTDALDSLNDVDVNSLTNADKRYYDETMKRINKKLSSPSSD